MALIRINIAPTCKINIMLVKIPKIKITKPARYDTAIISKTRLLNRSLGFGVFCNADL